MSQGFYFAHPFYLTVATLDYRFFEVHAEAVMKSKPAKDGQTEKVVGRRRRGGGHTALLCLIVQFLPKGN